MSRVLSVLLDLLFPPKCVFCGKLLRSGEWEVCAACGRDLPWLTGAAGEQRCEFVSLAVSPLRSEGAVRESIHRYKFSGRQGYAGAYGKLVAGCVREHLSGRWDLITWVPLSPGRRKERGYDQAFLLASAAALELGDVAVETLRKSRNNPAQSGIRDEAARRANVLGAYEIVDPELIRGRRVLLLDVITTGSTVSECARVLRTFGAEDVVCATLARAH